MCSWVGRINTVEVATLSRALHRVNRIPIIIPIMLYV